MFIVDNSDDDWKVLNNLAEWTEVSSHFDIATGYFEIGSLLALDGKWQKLDQIRILMGDEVTKRTHSALVDGIARVKNLLDDSIESEKQKNDFLTGVPAIVEAINSGKIKCRVYTKKKFHAKAYITHSKLAVVGSSALVGSSNFTYPGLTGNVELNVQLRREVEVLQQWYEVHWNDAEDVSTDVLKVIPEEMLEAATVLDRDQFDVPQILSESLQDLNQLAEFLNELRQFKPSHDDKLRALIHLLKTDPVLKKHKVMIFSEFMATARYLATELEKAGIKGIDQVDSATKRSRGDVIRQFAPYYNGMTSKDLADKGQPETRVLIATDVLSEGLNLQDATRLINYDLHWNPVRLMQRIGRVDRRMNPEIEKKLIKDRPDVKAIRGTVEYWNFLPPGELDELLNLYKKVSNKTLLISKTLGIEGKKLLRPEDDFAALRDFDHSYEGEPTALETMHLEYQRLLAVHPDLPARLEALPGRVFSGKAHVRPDAQAVFFCFGLPGKDNSGTDPATEAQAWTLTAGRTEWLLLDLETGKVHEDAAAIDALIHCEPETSRRCQIAQTTLVEARAKVEKHLKNGYLRQVQAPLGVAPELIAWLELN